MAYIGKSQPRSDAEGKVTGKTRFPGDINLPDQAYMKILFAQRPHAIVHRIDTSRAESLDGVLAVFTAKDVPVNEYGLIISDQPVLCGPESDKPNAERVRFIGDQIALVVAETEAIAQEAIELISVDFEDLPVVTDPLQAWGDDSVLLHPEKESNVFCHFRVRKGDVGKAFDDAHVVIEQEYRTPAQEHAYLQPEAGVAYIDDQGRVTVEVAGQWTHEDQEQIAHALGLSADQVRVIYPAIGGAFGGREDMSVQIVLALAAWRLHQRGISRPVKIIWSREESIIGHHKRHPYIIRTKWGASKEGKITAAEVEIIQDGGAYAYTSTKVLANATLMCTGPYEIPNVKVDALSIYTNNIPGGAFRGFGGPQAAFAAETQVNRIAEALEMDPVELRLRNVLKDGSIISLDTPIPKGVSISEVIEDCAVEAGWERVGSGWQRTKSPDDPAQLAHKQDGDGHLRRGIGFACGYKNVGFSFGFPENCAATVELQGEAEIEKAIVYHAGADVGQGTHTVMAQMAAHALGISIDKIEMVVSDTATSANAGSASASRMTFMAGNAIRGAADEALQKWHDEERPAISTYIYRPPATTPMDPETGKSTPNFAYGYISQAVTVEVDTETGLVRLVDVICSNDVGKAINVQQIEGQIEGAIVQAAGYTVLENFIQVDGHVLTPHLSTYLIPGVLDIPERVVSRIMEIPDEHGPWGARGMAEMPYIPLAPAVMAAVHDALGVWINDFPLTPERILSSIGAL